MTYVAWLKGRIAELKAVGGLGDKAERGRQAELAYLGREFQQENAGEMTYREAAQTRMPWGKYCGRTLDDIAESDKGLRYLDWLAGERQGRESHFERALRRYLNESSIAAEVDCTVT